jgi:sigma-54 dependent transcriptional regulator, flagellar regulatory protein
MTKVLEKSNTEICVSQILIGNSAHIIKLRQIIAKVAASSASVMILGPSGSGKEIVAQAIHAASCRSAEPFVALNCGAIPSELVESELFGHERGSFTGANARRTGRFEEASGGTLFLDEIGDMRFDMQVKLLRVLEDGKISRVGGNASLPVDVRIISATHQDIQCAIEGNRFRQDLFFRLGVVPVHVPDLASRTEDIPLLIAHFQRLNLIGDKVRFDSTALAALHQHDWPGNVRELRNLVERANVLFGGLTIGAREVAELFGSHLAPRLATEPTPLPLAPIVHISDPLSTASQDNMPIDLRSMLETMELERIQMALDMADGVVSEAARLLTLKRTTLIEKMRKYGVDRLA